jgi:hypothetical protein
VPREIGDEIHKVEDDKNGSIEPQYSVTVLPALIRRDIEYLFFQDAIPWWIISAHVASIRITSGLQCGRAKIQKHQRYLNKSGRPQEVTLCDYEVTPNTL